MKRSELHMAKPQLTPEQRSRAIVRILGDSFARKQKLRPEYSRRSLARDLGVSPAFVTGFTLTVNAGDTERLKARLLEFLSEFSQTATYSPGTDVYQCNLQFFPLTFPSTNEGT